ncbi:hypothetical protein [Streptomyces sp. BH105]|uniref:hypothetical protein n=1 Tax=Streptomyces sp. BH105 TaxID=3410408 RepID=UPI003CEEDA20
MTTVLTIDHPAWLKSPSGIHARAVRSGQGIWVLSWGPGGLNVDCVEGGEGDKPATETAEPTTLPDSVPGALRDGLLQLGTAQRLKNPWLWDALTTSILRQVVRADQARRLYREWCRAYGQSVDGPDGWLDIAPDPERVLGLADAEFADIGAKFHTSVLRSAAEAYLRHAPQWEQLPAKDLAEALTSVPRIGPWTAAATASDFTGDFSIYPHSDLAVRTWAQRIAPEYPWPDKKDKAFGPLWLSLAGPAPEALHALTLLTLTWGAHAPHVPLLPLNEEEPCRP